MERFERKENGLYSITGWERFLFTVDMDDIPVGTRFFRIYDFIWDSLNSEEMMDCMDYCVRMIQKDLESKSRTYVWYTATLPVKLTGFEDNGFHKAVGENLSASLRLTEEEVEAGVEPTHVDVPARKETYLTYPEDTTEEDVIPEPWTHTFKFSFYVAEDYDNMEDGSRKYKDYRKVYERIWDGSLYSSTVRKYIDLTNSPSIFEKLGDYTKFLVGRMLIGGDTDTQKGDGKEFRKNILRECEKVISETLSGDKDSVVYSKCLKYPNKVYGMGRPERKYIAGWEAYVKDKTIAYEHELKRMGLI